MKKIKILLQKPFVKNILAPVLRGALQTIPGGGIIVQGARNIGHELSEEKAEEKPPHNYISIAVQVIGIAVIVWSFYTKQITVDQVLSMIGFGL